MEGSLPIASLVGPHVLSALWCGTRFEYHHDIFGHLYPRAAEARLVDVGRPNLGIMLMRLDDVVYKFEEEAVADRHPQTRATLLGRISVSLLDLPADSLVFYNRVIEIRLRSNDRHEVLFGTDETTGLCLFEIGTDLDLTDGHGHYDDDLTFVLEVNPDGYTPRWLEDVDPDGGPVPIIKRYNPPTPKKTSSQKLNAVPMGRDRIVRGTKR